MPDVRANFAQTEVVVPDAFTWVPSPLPGVTRMMFDRVGDEVAVATSLVRYAAGSSFDPHVHELGEEFIVLEGEFGDENGRYPPGTYVRNPPGSRHRPFSEPGCLIYVKLRQFYPDDTRQCVLDLPRAGALHDWRHERVWTEAHAAGRRVMLSADGLAREAFVLDGLLRGDGIDLPRYSWLRLAPGDSVRLTVIEDCGLFVKARPITDG